MPKKTKTLLDNFSIKSWFILSLITFLCYAPFIFNFTWGNHDWEWIKEKTPLFSGLFEGRFSQFILQTIFFGGNILPIATILISLAFLSSAAIILLKLYNVPKKKYIYIILGLLLTTSPYTISWLYFSFITLSLLSWPFFIILGYYILNKTTKILSQQTLFATILFTLSIGGYPPTINLIATIFFSLMLIDLTNKTPIKELFIKYLPHIISILSSIILFTFTLYLLKKYNLMQPTYNTSQITLTDILPKILICLKTSFTQFFITTSFISTKYKLCNFVLVILAFYLLFTKLPKRPSAYITFFALSLGLLLSTTLTLFVAQNTQYVINEPRIDFLGIIYIYLFSVSVLIQSKSNLLKNTAYALIFIIIFYNITTIAYANKIWSLGFQAETKLMERVISRIENTPNFNAQKKHTFIQGGNLDFRSKFYVNPPIFTDSYTQTAPYIPWHLPSKAYKFYQPYDFFGADFDTFWRFVNPNIIYQNPNLINYIITNQSSWPHKNSLYIDNSSILLNLTTEGLKNSKQWLNKYH